MDEVKIWAIEDTAKVEELEAKGQMDTEWSLEDTLVKNPDLLMPEPHAGRQADADGGRPAGPPGRGQRRQARSVRVEARHPVARSHGAVIDYASDLDRMELGALAEHISERSGQHGVARLKTSRNGTTRIR